MPSNQLLEPYYRYQTLKLIKPNWTVWQKTVNVFEAYLSFFSQRWDILKLQLFKQFTYQVKFQGKNHLTKYLANGAIFVTVHSSTYPLIGKILNDHYPKIKLTVPFYFHRWFSIFPLFKSVFAKLNITIVPLGGAMKFIGPALEQGESVCLFLDAELPIKHLENVKMFGKIIPISSGPAYLATRYQKPIIPIYLIKKSAVITVKVLQPILIVKGSNKASLSMAVGKSDH